MARPRRTDEELRAQLAAATEAARIADLTEPRAVSAVYNPQTRRIELELRNGCLFAFPVDITQGLCGATDAQLAAVEVWDDGEALHWEELDEDYSVPGLLAGRFGTRRWLEQWGGSGWNARVSEHADAAVHEEPVRRRKAS